MKNLVQIFEWFYAQSLKFYPANFQAKFGEEMIIVFSKALNKALKGDLPVLLTFFGREILDWPGAVLREHMRTRKEVLMKQKNLTWKPLNPKEMLAGLALFVLPIISPFLTLIFGYKPVVNSIGSIFTWTILIIGLVIIILGVKYGFPRWSLPYLGVSITTIVMLQIVPPLWEMFYSDVQNLVHYSDKTLAARIQYSALLNGFFWLMPFVALILSILLLRVWPRTQALAQRIHHDWTLFSFMIYAGVAFHLELIFEEYIFDEAWKIACQVCLALGAWIYFKNADRRRRFAALMAGATFTYWIAAIGKWIVLPLQSWGAFYGFETNRRVELGSTLASWGWVMFFMLIPALMTLFPRFNKADPLPKETPTAT
jgi:hypothetical protein